MKIERIPSETWGIKTISLLPTCLIDIDTENNHAICILFGWLFWHVEIKIKESEY